MSTVLNRPERKAPILVPEATARAYENAPQEEKERVLRVLHFALLSRKAAAQELERIATKISTNAAERGLTPEKLDELFSDDAE